MTMLNHGAPNIPGFILRGELGRGGMATVYLAVQVTLEREIALKVMAAELAARDPSFQERFVREGQIIARLAHPNIVTVYDIGYADGVYFIAMEYLPGGNLKERILPSGIGAPEAIRIVRALASALDYAHRRGIIHRDLKPPNVMFRRDRQQPVLTDFGVARVRSVDSDKAATALTQVGVAVGTPAYMSPEQALAQPDVDGRADLYSLGVMFYELLVGRRPFISDDPYEVARMHVQAPPPRLPNQLRSLQPILDQLLAKAPRERFSDAKALLQALETWEQVGSVAVTAALDAPTVALVTDTLPAAPPVTPPPVTPPPVTPPPLDSPSEPFAWVSQDDATVVIPPAKARRWPRWVLAGVLGLGAALAAGWWYLQPAATTSPAQQLQSLLAQPWNAPEVERALALGAQLRSQQQDESTQALLRGLGARLVQMLKAKPDDPQATQWLQRGLVLLPTQAELLALQAQRKALEPQTSRATTPGLSRAEALQAQAQVQLAAGKWVEPPGDNAEETYRALRVWDLSAAEQGLRALADILHRQAQMAWERADTAQAQRWLALAQARFPADTRWAELAQRWQPQQSGQDLTKLAVPELLALAQRQFDAAQVTDPPGDNAVETYRQVLRRQADNAQAQAALRQIADGYEALAQARQAKGDWDKAALAVERGLQVFPEHTGLRALQAQVRQRQ